MVGLGGQLFRGSQCGAIRDRARHIVMRLGLAEADQRTVDVSKPREILSRLPILTILALVFLASLARLEVARAFPGEHTISAVWTDSRNNAGYRSATATIKIDVAPPSS